MTFWRPFKQLARRRQRLLPILLVALLGAVGCGRGGGDGGAGPSGPGAATITGRVTGTATAEAARARSRLPLTGDVSVVAVSEAGEDAAAATVNAANPRFEVKVASGASYFVDFREGGVAGRTLAVLFVEPTRVGFLVPAGTAAIELGDIELHLEAGRALSALDLSGLAAPPAGSALLFDGDGDGVPDVRDRSPDQDGDGVADADDSLPFDPRVPGTSPDRDGDGVADVADAFPDEPAASVDTDGDGFPDAFNPGATAEQIAASGLAIDAFPADPAASQDTDRDGFPDRFNPGATQAQIASSGLVLDAFPRDPAVALDSDRDGFPDRFNPGATPDQIAASTLLVDPFPNDPTRPPPLSGEVKSFAVSAIEVDITVDRFGDHDPLGRMYVLTENIPSVRAQETAPLPDRVSTGLRDDPIQPLVIRANIGDTVQIQFTNRLAGERAGIHIHGLGVVPQVSSGADVGLNPDTTVGPGQTITYTWRIPSERNAEGSYVFNSLGTSMRQQIAHGLFGVLNVEPRGSVYLSPVTGEPIRSGWEAMIVDPGGKDFREDTIIYHEIGDELFDVVDRDGGALPINDPFNEDAYRPGSRAINYRSEPFLRRQELLEQNLQLLGHIDNSQNYGSYMFGDPPTPRPRGYLGDPTKRRIVHAGSERFHVEHLHGGSIRWPFDPFAPEPSSLAGGPDFFGLNPDAAVKNPPLQTRSQRLDSQAVGPLEAYTAAIEGTAGGLQRVPADFLFHCHFGHHYTVGMWSFWRVFDTLQTGAAWQMSRFPLVELPDRAGTTPEAVDSTRLIGMRMPSGRTLTTGPTTDSTLNLDEWLQTKLPPQGDPGPEADYDASVWNWVRAGDVAQLTAAEQAALATVGIQPLPGRPVYLGEPETTLEWANYRSPTPGVRLPIMFNPRNARPAYPLMRPHLGRRPPFAPLRSGSPYLGDPVEGFPEEHPGSLIPAGARRLEYTKVTIPLAVTTNQAAGITNPQASLPVLDEDKADILAGVLPAEPLTVRANAGDGIDVIHYSEIPPETFEFFKSNLHYHFVQFDNQASDGVITGMAYEQSVRPYTEHDITLANGAPSGSTEITVAGLDADILKVNAFIGIGFGNTRRVRVASNVQGPLNANGGFEWAQITARNGDTLTLDRALRNNHTAGEVVGTEFVRQQLYADADVGTTYFHNHVFAVPGFGLSLTGALIQEPPDAVWQDPATGEEIRSGSFATIRTSRQVAPGIPVQDFREWVLYHMNAVTGVDTRAGGETAAFNLKQEPLDLRLGEPAQAFSSVTHGDPETPILKAYVGDLGVIRLMSASGHDTGTFHIAGHRFRVTRFDPLEVPKDTVTLGISERYDLFFTAGSVGLQAGDYPYMNTLHEKMLDAWGLLRVFDTARPDLQTIQTNVPLRAPDQTTFPQNTVTGGAPPPAAEPGTLAELKTKLERNGYSLMDGRPIGEIPVRTYDVVAIEQDIAFSPDFIRTNGRAYVLAEDEAAVRGGLKPLEPLVIRGNIGEVVRVNFRNGLAAGRASLHVPQLIQTRDSLGGAFGLNDDSTVGPGETRTYWYVIDPRFEVPRGMLIHDFGSFSEGAANGLYGVFVVEPEGATYHDPVTGAEVRSGADVEVRTPDRTFRDVVLIFHENDPRMNRDIMPYNQEVNGDRGINYRAQPFTERGVRPFPADILDSDVFGDPRTPVIEVQAGTEVHLHVTQGHGQQTHVFTLQGHRFPFDTSRPDGLALSARMFGPSNGIDTVIRAGGLLGAPGDYLYRDGRNPFFEAGLWGILRVRPAAR